ncbi:MAG: hypothetical protein HYW69_00185 [Candidatus Nealsonbacteria bacterium]|nr:hypothetical protein [Candidatus Nealsonbacteria bacterium]
MRNKIILSIIILAALAGIFGFWYYQRNIYSKEVLKLEILGPDEVDVSEEIEYAVKYKNNGNIRLEKPRLTFEYPEYSIVENGKLLRQEIVLEDIYPGQSDTIYFRGRLMGKAGDIKKAKAWLSYAPKNLKARYESETSHAAKIKSVPITLEFDLPSKIESGGEIRFRLNYFSNADYPLSDLGIRIEYPQDFEFMSSNPKTLGENEWEVGLLNKAEGGRIEIVGNLKGELGQDRTFKAQLGVWQSGSFVVLKESIRAVQIVTPSLYISQQINNNPQYVASPGDTLHYEVFFRNIGQEPFNNLFLVVRLEGEAFDFQTLKAPIGDFEPGDNSIVFDWRRLSDLRFLDAQKEGKVEFWVDLKKNWAMQGSQDMNPVIRNRVYLSQANQEFITKVNSKLEITQQSYYQDEVFGNSGPIPPEVGKTTTYTVVWQAKNYYNDVNNVQVKAVFGQGVNLTGKIFPEDAALTFDSNSREVVWKLENLVAGKGVLGEGPNVVFQVAFTPTALQKGMPELIGKAIIAGEDQFTGQTIKTEAAAINIDLSK